MLIAIAKSSRIRLTLLRHKECGLIKLYSVGGYQGPGFESAIKQMLARLNVEIVKRSGQATGFVALPQSAGSSNAHSLGWAAADDWPRTGNATTTRRSPSPPRFNPSHAAKAMQSRMMFSDRL